jgi:hypothetical protein
MIIKTANAFDYGFAELNSNISRNASQPKNAIHSGPKLKFRALSVLM